MGDVFALLIVEIVPILVLVLAGIAVAWYRENAKSAVVREIITDGVLFAQQVYGHLNGPARFELAKKEIVRALQRRRVKITDEDLEVMIESTLKLLKAEYGDKM